MELCDCAKPRFQCKGLGPDCHPMRVNIATPQLPQFYAEGLKHRDDHPSTSWRVRSVMLARKLAGNLMR